MDNGPITAILISFISVFGGFGTGVFLGVVLGTKTPNGRAIAFIGGTFSALALMCACMWLIKHGTL